MDNGGEICNNNDNRPVSKTGDATSLPPSGNDKSIFEGIGKNENDIHRQTTGTIDPQKPEDTDKDPNDRGDRSSVVPTNPTTVNNPNTTNNKKKYDNDTQVWFAMSATFGRSLKAQEKLEGKDIESYVPKRWGVKQGKCGHKQKGLIPVVSNLIFVNTTWNKMVEMKREMPWLQMQTYPFEGRNVPIVVPKKQMEDFIAVTSASESLSGGVTYMGPEEMNLKEGERVRIIGGPFNNVEGVFMNARGKGKRRELVVEIPHIIAARTIIKDYDLIEVLRTEGNGKDTKNGRTGK